MAYTAQEDKQRGRLRDLEVPGEGPGSSYIDFFYIPGEISEEVTPDWQDIVVIGRSSPLHAYGSTGARSVSLELNFFAESNAKQEVFQKVQWIQSLKYPEYRGKFMKPPHKVSLIIGRFIGIDGILKSADVTWKAPFEVETMYPMFATVNITIEEAVDTPYDYRTVREGSKVGVADLLQEDRLVVDPFNQGGL